MSTLRRTPVKKVSDAMKVGCPIHCGDYFTVNLGAPEGEFGNSFCGCHDVPPTLGDPVTLLTAKDGVSFAYVYILGRRGKVVRRLLVPLAVALSLGAHLTWAENEHLKIPDEALLKQVRRCSISGHAGTSEEYEDDAANAGELVLAYLQKMADEVAKALDRKYGTTPEDVNHGAFIVAFLVMKYGEW